jgi:hypothetical protein
MIHFFLTVLQPWTTGSMIWVKLSWTNYTLLILAKLPERFPVFFFSVQTIFEGSWCLRCNKLMAPGPRVDADHILAICTPVISRGPFKSRPAASFSNGMKSQSRPIRHTRATGGDGTKKKPQRFPSKRHGGKKKRVPESRTVKQSVLVCWCELNSAQLNPTRPAVNWARWTMAI